MIAVRLKIVYSILCYDTLYVIIQSGQQSGVVQSGKLRKKKYLFKVGQRKSGMSGNLKKVWKVCLKTSDKC